MARDPIIEPANVKLQTTFPGPVANISPDPEPELSGTAAPVPPDRGSVYEKIDSNRALEHYTALASVRGAPWSDSLPLARMYGELDRHHEAAVVFRRILPDLIRALDGPLGNAVRDARHLRRAAMSLAVEGDVAGAANLLRLERPTPEARIPAEIEQLRKSAPKPGGIRGSLTRSAGSTDIS